MKIRKGFVSNSSSSSFIVVFDKRPKNSDELQKILFGDRKEYHSPYDAMFWSANEVANTVWATIKGNKKSAKMKDIIDTIKNGYLPFAPGCPDIKDFINMKGSKETYDWDAYNKATIKWSKQIAESFFGEHIKDSFICIFSFSDNDGTYMSALEHGDLFGNLDNVLKISYH